jgi:hypothetical protein
LRARPGTQTRLVLPNFLIIGAQKSGTSALASYLRAHPQVFMPDRKELHFFDLHWSKGVAWYEAHFTKPEGVLAIGEASPPYLSDPESHERMAKVVPEAKLIAILRNPVDRAYSHYWHSRARRREPLEFEEALAAEADRIAAAPNPRIRDRYAYVARGMYLDQLLHLCQYYPRDALSVLTLDELGADPLGTYAKLCTFLGIDPSFAPSHLGDTVYTYRRYRWKWANRVLARVPKGALKQRLKKLNRTENAYPPMQPHVRARLIDLFREPNARLGDWLNKDLSSWST